MRSARVPLCVLALLAAAVSCAVGAETYSSQADQARRERNREEALANYRAGIVVGVSRSQRLEPVLGGQGARVTQR